MAPGRRGTPTIADRLIAAAGHLDAALANAGRSLDAAGIAWAILRRAANPDGRPGDIDLLIAHGRVGAAVDVLRRIGFERLAWQSGRSVGVWRFDPDARAWVWLDLHGSMAAGIRPVPAELVRRLLARRRQVRGLWFLHPADEFWAILLASFSEGRRLQERHHRRLLELTREDDPTSPLRDWLERTRHPLGLIANARQLAEGAAWGQLDALASPHRRSGHAFVRRLSNALRALFDPRRRGVSVALLGPDGAGKSTTADALARAYPFPSRRIYMGVGPPPGERRGAFGLIVGSGFGMATQWLRYLAGRYHKLRGRLVVFDRYAEDPWLPQPEGRSAIRRLGHRLRVAVACPPADLMAVLDVPGEVMYARKHEHDVEWLEAQRRRYLALGDRLPGTVILDGTLGPDRVLADLEMRLWDVLRARLGVAREHQEP